MKREHPGRVELAADLYEAGLSPWAQRSSASRGRERAEEPCSLRTAYQRDRDRIVHSKSFRRLKHKTQVFISPEGDHYRTRLTHTLEVSGIARTAARALRLNEDLAEAIALGHDLGHTPFGHAGESVLDQELKRLGLGGFEHNQQSARVVEVLENEGKGLNLTWEVRDGIRHHSGDDAHPSTLEAEIVHLADRIAYVNHDIDDALRAGLIKQRDLPKGPVKLLGETGSDRIDALVHDLVDASAEVLAAAPPPAGTAGVAGVSASGDVQVDAAAGSGESAQAAAQAAALPARPGIVQTPEIGEAMLELREFLFATVYARAQEQSGGERIRQLLVDLLGYFLEHPEALPATSPRGGGAHAGADRTALVRAVTDHVAGMTDRYAQRLYLELFMPRCWGDL